jgi:hypothetical protein
MQQGKQQGKNERKLSSKLLERNHRRTPMYKLRVNQEGEQRYSQLWEKMHTTEAGAKVGMMDLERLSQTEQDEFNALTLIKGDYDEFDTLAWNDSLLDLFGAINLRLAHEEMPVMEKLPDDLKKYIEFVKIESGHEIELAQQILFDLEINASIDKFSKDPAALDREFSRLASIDKQEC